MLLCLLILDGILLLCCSNSRTDRLLLTFFAELTAVLATVSLWHDFGILCRTILICLTLICTVALIVEIFRESDKSVVIRSRACRAFNGVWVDQGAFAIAPMHVALGTGGLATCVGLVAVDDAANKHYLAHVDRSVTAFDLKYSLKDIHNKGTRFYIRQGLLTSSVYLMIVATLDEMGVSERNIHELDYRWWRKKLMHSGVHGLVSVQNQFYNDARHQENWNLKATKHHRFRDTRVMT